MQSQSCTQSLFWEGLDGRQKQIACGIVYLQADMVLTEDPVDTVIAATSEDVLAIRASKMPRMRRGEVWEPKYQ